MSQTVTAPTALDWLAASNHDMLDVRSEGEYASASLPGFSNAPILRDQERHEVGLCYRLRGQTAAIELGYQLVGNSRTERVEQWLKLTRPDAPLVVSCWRGGLRSRIAAEWIEACGRHVVRVEGGYKAMRHELLQVLAEPPRLLVITGLTGAGKTRLLDALPLPEKLNIEELAAHRGSSFGKFLQRAQPTQANFENRLGIGLRSHRRPVLVEDESKVIGQLHLPASLMSAIFTSPVIVLDATLEERCFSLYQEYVVQVLETGVAPQDLEAQLIANTLKLQRRLGGLLTSKIVQQIRDAFVSADETAHFRWIATLLTEYYDARYTYSQLRTPRPLAFQGNYEECQQWILNQYD